MSEYKLTRNYKQYSPNDLALGLLCSTSKYELKHNSFIDLIASIDSLGTCEIRMTRQ